VGGGKSGGEWLVIIVGAVALIGVVALAVYLTVELFIT